MFTSSSGVCVCDWIPQKLKGWTEDKRGAREDESEFCRGTTQPCVASGGSFALRRFPFGLHSAGGSHCCLDLSSLSNTTVLVFNIVPSLPPHADWALVKHWSARSYVAPESLNLADYSKLDHLSGANGNYMQAARMLPLRQIQGQTGTLGANSERRKTDTNSLFGESECVDMALTRSMYLYAR